jgi:hypothetical protein
VYHTCKGGWAVEIKIVGEVYLCTVVSVSVAVVVQEQYKYFGVIWFVLGFVGVVFIYGNTLMFIVYRRVDRLTRVLFLPLGMDLRLD